MFVGTMRRKFGPQRKWFRATWCLAVSDLSVTESASAGQSDQRRCDNFFTDFAASYMDVFLEQETEWAKPSVVSRIAVSMPLQASSLEELIAEAEQLEYRGIRYVSVRRQQVLRIGEHTLHDVLASFGISVNCLGFAGGFTGSLGMSYDHAIDDVHRAADLAADLGARFLVIVPGEQGLHTYNHAERTVRMGLTAALYYADQCRVQLLIPNDTVFGCLRDVFRTRECALHWVEQLGSRKIRPLIIVRGETVSCRLPLGWRESLASGGCLRVCHRCRNYDQNSRLLAGVLTFLARNGGVTGFERLATE